MFRKRIEVVSAEVDKCSLRSGELVVVDGASLAGTFALDTLTEQARNAGAKVVLVGDWAQLSAVEAGGAFHLLVHDRDLAPELADVRRFTHAWGKAASFDLPRFEKQLYSQCTLPVWHGTSGQQTCGVSGTPTFFVNGRRQYGTFDPAALTSAIASARGRERISPGQRNT